MKLSINRQEKTGPFGGKYYETEVTLSMSYEEKEVTRKQKLLNAAVLGSNNPEESEAKFSFLLTNEFKITVDKLTSGVKAKVDNESQLHNLAKFENLIRERCKVLKERIEASESNKESFQAGNASYEEEL